MLTKTVRVNASEGYTVHIGGGLLAYCGCITRSLCGGAKALVVCDRTVCGLYGSPVQKALTKAGYDTVIYSFPAGEPSKSIHTVMDIIRASSGHGLTRDSVIVALGGGVTGDTAGFAASIYMRGIKYVQVPTTLLAAVDASVGGKTGIDTEAGKNTAGSFYQPSAVICDTDTFKTLPEDTVKDGLAEVIKYGCIGSKALFEALESGAPPQMDALVEMCVSIKGRLVERDERDTGERRLLNFGHTAGHAIEALSGYAVSHGMAVAAGMLIMTGAFDKTLAQRLFRVYKRLGISPPMGYSAGRLICSARTDKKHSGSGITLALVESIGHGYLETVSRERLREIFERGVACAWTLD